MASRVKGLTIEYEVPVKTAISKKKKDDSDVATSVKYDVVSFSSWSKSIYNFVTNNARIRESHGKSVISIFVST